MARHSIFLVLLLGCSVFQLVRAQKEDLTQVWPSFWIEPDKADTRGYSVSYFRKTFTLEQLPDSLVVHTSGDQIYKLYVNGQFATRGPQTGDLRHWHYETTDIKPFVREGKNVIAAVVLNYGSHPPDSRLTVQTGFLLTASDRQHRFLNTGDSWKAFQSKAYTPNRVDNSQVHGYYGGGSREIVDGNLHVWGWENPEFDDYQWAQAQIIERAFAKTCRWASRWKLTPRTLPHEELISERFHSVRKTKNVTVTDQFTEGNDSIIVNPHTTATILLDFGKVTTAYPILTLSSGANASIKITYSEAGYTGDVRDREKGNRNEIKGKTFTGYFDKYIADGGWQRIYEPLWWRTFRYVVLEIETQDDPLILNDFSTVFSAYPFRVQSSFQLTSDYMDSELIDQILTTGIRTVRLCSHETYVDCPYYEESQFQGDTRIQALVSYLNFGDGSLGKNAIEQFSWSLNNEGFMSARYPTNSLYYIPNYSLYWIGMLYDYMMFFNDKDFVQSKLNVSRFILNYFISLQRPDGLLNKPDYHNFVDWSFPYGEPPFDDNGYSAIVDLHFLIALQWAIELERYAGETHYLELYEKLHEDLALNIKNTYWNHHKQLFRDTPNGDKYSQHTNSLAVLTGLVQGKEAQMVMEKVLTGKDMTIATLYWSFYVFEAMHEAGMSNEYTNHLDVWKETLAAGVTTWPETGLNSRSECHGWGASPNYHFYKNVAGIQTVQPEFAKVRIQPALGKHTNIDVTVPHHSGEIRMTAKQNANNQITAQIYLPENVYGTFIWDGKETPLKAGMNFIP